MDKTTKKYVCGATLRRVQRLVLSGISKGLIIRNPHIGKILDGLKTWEMRSTKTKIRGRIALIEAGSGMIVGECEIVASRECPTKFGGRMMTKDLHQIEAKDFHLMDKWKYYWLIENAIRYEEPIPYDHPQGAVIWVNLL